jgi:hypothetical protein
VNACKAYCFRHTINFCRYERLVRYIQRSTPPSSFSPPSTSKPPSETRAQRPPRPSPPPRSGVSTSSDQQQPDYCTVLLDELPPTCHTTENKHRLRVLPPRTQHRQHHARTLSTAQPLPADAHARLEQLARAHALAHPLHCHLHQHTAQRSTAARLPCLALPAHNNVHTYSPPPTTTAYTSWA